MKNCINKRGVTALLVSAVLCTTVLAGCNTGGDGKDSGGTKAPGSALFTGELEKNVTIRVLENDTAVEKGYLKVLLSAFNEAYKDKGITAVDANMDQYLDLANDGPYGYGPDVLYQANDVLMKYVDGKHILPLPIEKMECYDKVPEVAWNAYKATVADTVYTCGIPVNVQAPMLYYRKDSLPENWETDWDNDKNGIADMLESWNAMYAYSLDRHTADSSKYGYMKSQIDVYFSAGFLFSYGAYIFGENNTKADDIGFAAGDAAKGASILKQFATVMNEESIDFTITQNAYSKIADGTYFATISTPDVYTLFLKELALAYGKEGLSEEEALKKAEDNLVMTYLPKLPKSGDLMEKNPELMESKAMGGVNGYAVSAYTKAPNACLEFINFATSYNMMLERNKLLGVAPAREDAAKTAGGTSSIIYEKFASGNVVVMPSIQAVAQIWTPAETFFSDITKDAFRPEKEQKYKDLAAFQAGLEAMSKQIHDAIFTLTK